MVSIKKVKETNEFLYLLNKLSEYNISYITNEYLKDDFINNRLYTIGNLKGIATVVYDSDFGFYYIKRLLIFERGKGYSKSFLKQLTDKYKKCAITPFKDNTAVINTILNLGYKYQYTFLNDYLFYTYHKEE